MKITNFSNSRMDEYLLGFTVDSVSEILRIQEEDIVGTPPTLTNFDKRFLSGVAKVEEKLILLLNLEKILTPDEENQVKEMVEKNESQLIG